ncbi:GGDEF domain-containing phosphodiesterase [Salirhabdus salicampi]|uniref:GGDEF domain-containing phosphodiesterase n=1 Tax=Salirhabdus salicampi TaxID=476102 RepID=UPI0020C1F44B|nr:GGDEF domain-containing phosphodiesterase [Salirhabdus salicampi]MCP8615773.1 EAL domain-containing protein [Salirhabdus salicampi]
MKYKGRLTATTLTTLAATVNIYIDYLELGFVKVSDVLIHIFFILIAWLLGKQYDRVQYNARKLEKQKLESRYQNEKYRSLFEHNPDAVFELNKNGKFIAGNPSLEKLTLCKQEDLLGSSFIPFIHPLDIEKAVSHFRGALKGNMQQYNIRVVRRGGEVRYVYVTSFPNYVGDTITGTYGIAKDITEAKLAEDEIKKVKTNLQTTLREQQGMTLKIVKKNQQFIVQLSDGELLYRMGLTPDLITGKSLQSFFSKERAEQMEKWFNQAWSGKEVEYVGEYKGITYLVALRPVKQDGKVVEIIASGIDISDRKRAEEALEKSEEKYRIIAENTSDIIIVLNEDCAITFISPSYQQLLGFDPEDLIGKTDLHFVHPEDVDMLQEKIYEVKQDEKPISTLFRGQTSEGEYVWLDTNLTPVLKEQKLQSIIIVSRDITERKQLEEELSHMAYHDLLTGLANRRKFEDSMKEAIFEARNQGSHAALIYFDIDRFKIINDTLGHDIGDLLLQHVGARLKNVVRQNDLLIRMGGDEFALILSTVEDYSIVHLLAERIIKVFQEPFYVEGKEINVTTSVGISYFPEHGEDINSLLQAADHAMYTAKEKGKNQYHVYMPELIRNRYNRLQLENDLRKAVQRKELYVLYQPKVCTNSNEIVAVEALVRWNHSEYGVIPPDVFIPIAEETGFINTVGDFVLEEACKQNVRWQQKGYPSMRVCVNLSVNQFLSQDLMEMIQKHLEKTGMSAWYLELEITETIMMRDVDHTIEQLNRLKELGVKISIDDFGTGYSSLSMIQQLPIDTLKIDRSFVQNIPENKNNMAITSLVIEMGKKLSMAVVAEGVENEEQRQFLRKHGCDVYQGYYFSPPVNGEEIENLFKKRSET